MGPLPPYSSTSDLYLRGDPADKGKADPLAEITDMTAKKGAMTTTASTAWTVATGGCRRRDGAAECGHPGSRP